jgi:hypothetical protein
MKPNPVIQTAQFAASLLLVLVVFSVMLFVDNVENWLPDR